MTEKNLYKVSCKDVELDKIVDYRIVATTMREAVEYAEIYQREQEFGEIIAVEWRGEVLIEDGLK